MTQALFGVDLGGTKIEAVVMTPSGQELVRERVATPVGDYDATIRAMADLLRAVAGASGLATRRVWIGIPGSISPSNGLVRNGNSTWLNGRDLALDCRDALGVPVRLSNDANCLALSEARDGAGQGAASVLAVVLGTGVGSGVVVNGQIVEGANRIGGEIGHIPLPGEIDGRKCFCGRTGCVETFLSGPGLLADFRAHGGREATSAKEVSARADADPIAKAAIRRHRARLARMLGLVMNILDPDAIILGGGVSLLPGLAEELPGLIRPLVFAPPGETVHIRVARAAHGDSSGVRGAARLWDDQNDG